MPICKELRLNIEKTDGYNEQKNHSDNELIQSQLTLQR